MMAANREMMAEMKVQIGGLASRLDADKAEMKSQIGEMMNKMDNNKEEMIKAIMGASRELTEACDGKTKALLEATEACPEVTHAWLKEERESTPKEMDAVEEPQVLPKGATDEEEFGATKDQTGEQRLAVRRRRERKKRAQEKGGPRHKFAAFRGRFTRRAVPAMRKGHVRWGPGKRCCRSSIERPGKASRTGKREESVKWRTKNKVVQGTPKKPTCEENRRTRPVFENGLRQSTLVRNGMRSYEAFHQKFAPEAVRTAFESSIRLQEPGNGTPWKCRPPPKRKR
jgi:hypothetical protein